MKALTSIVLAVLLGGVLHAQAPSTPVFRASMVAAVAAHGADLATTEYCIGAGRCHELNHFLARFDQPAVFGAVKMGIAAGQLWLVAKMHESHPRWATAINFVTAGAFTVIAAHNTRQGGAR